MAPSYLTEDFTRMSDSHGYNTRHSNFSYNICHVKTYGSKSFYHTGKKLWNNLPNNIKQIDDLGKYKLAAKNYYLGGVMYNKHFKSIAIC